MADGESSAAEERTAEQIAERPLQKVMEDGWAEALEPVAGRIAAMGDFLRAEIAAGRAYLPAGENVLRAFQQPFDDVRVLIVGQDPYPTPGHPVGLSFSVGARGPAAAARAWTTSSASTARRPRLPARRRTATSPRGPSTACCCSTGCSPCSRASPARTAARAGRRSPSRPSGRWSARGGAAGRDPVGPRRPQPRPRCSAASPRSSRPTPARMSADRGFFGSRPFSRANDLLEAQGADPVDWRLP